MKTILNRKFWIGKDKGGNISLSNRKMTWEPSIDGFIVSDHKHAWRSETGDLAPFPGPVEITKTLIRKIAKDVVLCTGTQVQVQRSSPYYIRGCWVRIPNTQTVYEVKRARR